MRFLRTLTVLASLATAFIATSAAANIGNNGIYNWRLHSNHQLIRQEGYRTFRSSTDGKRYETAHIVWERPNGSRYKRYTWCQLDQPRRCSAKNTVVELRGATSVPEPTPYTGNGTVARKPINTDDRYISQRNYRIRGNRESAWVKFARRNGNLYEVRTSCRINTTNCSNGEVRELGYDRRYDRRQRGGNYGRWNNLTDKQKECVAGAGIIGAIDDSVFESDAFKFILLLCLIGNK
ncbi:MAG: hypothetical protein VX730_08215 [Pseudomonadota bacterium]|nr:hypothetical protein [Pseudomonadota bacterium]